MRQHQVLGLIFSAALTVIACDKNADKPRETGTTGGQIGSPPPAAAPAAAQFDRQFIDMMVPHHEQGIMMAKMALDRAQHAELKTMAQKIIEDQQRDITAMKGLRKQWFGSDTTPSMDQMPMLPGMSMTADMHRMMDPNHARAQLDQAKSFDKAWIDTMIDHHKMAIQAADLDAQQGAHDELKTLAKKMRDAQQGEVDRLEAKRREWFGAK